MSKSKYRNLTVDGSNYRYVIGKSVVKIRNEDTSVLVQKSNIGILVGRREIKGKPHSEWPDMYEVHPKMIADYIRHGKIGPKEDYFPSCGCDAPKELIVLPFGAEIYGKIHRAIYCEDCHTANAMAI